MILAQACGPRHHEVDGSRHRNDDKIRAGKDPEVEECFPGPSVSLACQGVRLTYQSKEFGTVLGFGPTRALLSHGQGLLVCKRALVIRVSKQHPEPRDGCREPEILGRALVSGSFVFNWERKQLASVLIRFLVPEFQRKQFA